MPQLPWGVSFSLKMYSGPVAPPVHHCYWVSAYETLRPALASEQWREELAAPPGSVSLVVFPVRISN